MDFSKMKYTVIIGHMLDIGCLYVFIEVSDRK